MPGLALGVPVVAARLAKFTPDECLRVLREGAVRNVFFPPTALRMLKAADCALEGLRSVASGGEPLGAEMLDWGRRAFGVTINEFYGQTECNMVASSCSALFAPRPGCIGKPAPGFRIGVIDAQGHETEGEGDIAIRWGAGSMMLEYWDRPEDTAAKFRGDWMVTGDRGMWDGAFLRFAGREDDVITSAGYRIGPAEIEAAARSLADAHGAEVETVTGAALAEGYPMIEAVGRAAAPGREPRLISLSWGPEDAPRITLVGKGVAFDTGGLGLKPAAAMALMKKDMGGAAQVLGLARAVMAEGLAVRLSVLIPAVENAVSAASFRPGDILRSRKGLTVEVNHTDAEGRLVLADALARADEDAPDLLLCFATLTGAARVALGPELAPLYTDDEPLAAAMLEAARRVRDPLWRMPLWPGYEELIEPRLADLDNAPTGGMAGSITAALFLRRFVEQARAFAHLDVYAWTPKARPGRPQGGEAQGLRAAFEVIAARAGG